LEKYMDDLSTYRPQCVADRRIIYDDDLLAQITHNNIPIVQTISHRIWVYPATVAFPERLYNPIHKKDMPPDIYAEVIDSFNNFHRLSYFYDIGTETRNSKVAARQFIEAGAYMGVGTDAASPLNFHTEAMWYEMSALVESGMTPIQVISAATKTNAEILGQFEQLGTIEPGKMADMIVIWQSFGQHRCNGTRRNCREGWRCLVCRKCRIRTGD